MKKLLILVLVLLCAPALAEIPDASAVLPVRLLEYSEAEYPLESALILARDAVGEVPAQALIRAELAELSDGSRAWIVTIYDTRTFQQAWCITLDASKGEIISLYGEQDIFFNQTSADWGAVKGPHALWSLEDKQLYDALYNINPVYGLPQEGDISAETALEAALVALGLPSAEGYEVGFGYIMGGAGYNGLWEVYLVRDGKVAYQVNLDAVDGSVYYMEPDDSNNG